MAIRRLDNVLVVVEDLEAAKAFFVALGMELEGEMPVEGHWVDRVIGVAGTQATIAMMRTPDGHGGVELTSFARPAPVRPEPANAPSNTLGLRRIMFLVDDLDATLERLRGHGATLVGDVVNYEDVYRLCFVRGPEGILLGLSEEVQ